MTLLSDKLTARTAGLLAVLLSAIVLAWAPGLAAPADAYPGVTCNVSCHAPVGQGGAALHGEWEFEHH